LGKLNGGAKKGLQGFHNANWESFEVGFLKVPPTKENLFFISSAVAINRTSYDNWFRQGKGKQECGMSFHQDVCSCGWQH